MAIDAEAKDLAQEWRVRNLRSFACRAFLHEGFLSDAECDHLVALVSSILQFRPIWLVGGTVLRCRTGTATR